MNRVLLPFRILSLMKGNAIPLKLEPPPKQAITISGSSPAISICFLASWPMTVWWRQTWFSTEPSVYLQFGVLMASSIASEMAVPREPESVGLAVMMSFPALVDMDGDAIGVDPKTPIMVRL